LAAVYNSFPFSTLGNSKTRWSGVQPVATFEDMTLNKSLDVVVCHNQR